MTADRIAVELVMRNIASSEEIQLVAKINGWTIETMNDILYARTGCRNLEQFLQEVEQ